MILAMNSEVDTTINHIFGYNQDDEWEKDFERFCDKGRIFNPTHPTDPPIGEEPELRGRGNYRMTVCGKFF